MLVRVPIAVVLAAALVICPAARAAGPPVIVENFITDVTATSANLRARINPNGLSATYRFEYITQANFEASGYATAKKAPASGAAALGSGSTPLVVTQHLNALIPATAYRYRVLATNSQGTTPGIERGFGTQEVSLTFHLPDERGWEMVSPIDKGGGVIAAPEELFGGGDLQAAASGEEVTYGSDASFGEAQGAPPVSQYLSIRTSGGWVTENVSAPIESAAYGDHPDGAPFRLFSEDLSVGLLFGGLACRAELEGCPPNPVLAGSGAPAGHMAYYLRSSATGAFSSLLHVSDLAHTPLPAKAFAASFVAASPDLTHIVLSSCAALSANATEVPDGPQACDSTAQNLYEWSASGLVSLSLLPGEATTTPEDGPTKIAAPLGAVSLNGSRVYFTAEGGVLYLREGAQTKLVSSGGQFQTASGDGSVAFITEAGHLYRYLAQSQVVTDLTPAGGVVGVLGASGDGSVLYYQDAAGIERWQEGTTTLAVAGASATIASDYPPASATTRVSVDGSHLAFLSRAELNGYDNGSQTEAYIYGPPAGGGAPRLYCASCNPTGERAQGAAAIPGTPANGSLAAYRPRALSANGLRLFFSSADVLAVQDTNSHPDVYEWEAQGVGSCQLSPGCTSLISSGRSNEGATFIDASADGSDVYFTTDGSLVADDPGSVDLYDARVGGGFPASAKPIPCIADACQSLPPTPDDPDPGTLVKSSGNPPFRIDVEKTKKHKRKKKHKHHRKGHRHRNDRGAHK